MKDFSTLLNRLSGMADEMSSYFRRMRDERRSIEEQIEQLKKRGIYTMTELQISVFDKNGELKCQASDQDQAIMVFEGTYEEGDTLVFETSNTGAFYVDPHR